MLNIATELLSELFRPRRCWPPIPNRSTRLARLFVELYRSLATRKSSDVFWQLLPVWRRTHYWPAVYLGGDITFSNFEQPIRRTLNASAAAIQVVRKFVQNIPFVAIVQAVGKNKTRRIITREPV
jgi:hypothetical protein